LTFYELIQKKLILLEVKNENFDMLLKFKKRFMENLVRFLQMRTLVKIIIIVKIYVNINVLMLILKFSSDLSLIRIYKLINQINQILKVL